MSSRPVPSRNVRLAALTLLTVIGFVAPNAFVYRYFKENGLSGASVRAYFAHWVDSIPTQQLTADLLITSGAFGLWSFWDAQRRGVRAWWAVIPATFGVGICFAVPLYLLLRELVSDG
ncbi:DUF2834 domain-containing protein [Aldersonia sp. NBC_00410]|uniref:DUF2834 domain-containing protein n=1 Tax=Aldersonia sp. NBC_00410 TaxID=2975954 RepID=UPI002256D9DC|nr:DUF2834 domain-containing protein [Aldersonia sp. NBC_00410]MCX5042186.1 DUF2834 domain-containing protein [Aldersonia sp. NBC_00410]